MSDLQQEAVRIISGLSDENIRFLIEVIHRLMPQDGENNAVVMSSEEQQYMQMTRGCNNISW